MTLNKECTQADWKPDVYRAAVAIDTAAPGSVFGTYNGHSPNKRLAVDFMCSIPVGEKIVAHVLPRMKYYGIHYVIHNKRIYSQTYPNLIMRGGRAYDPGPPRTASRMHTNHVHISWYSTSIFGRVVQVVTGTTMYAAEPVKGYSKAGAVLHNRLAGYKITGTIKTGNGGEKYLVTRFGTWYPVARLTEHVPSKPAAV